MKRSIGITIVLTALAGSGAVDIAAQDEVAERRRGRRGPAVEAIMQMRDRLELTDGQIAELETIRRESVQRRNAEMAELNEMRSQLAAGQIQRSDMMAFMEDRREANAGLSEQRGAQLEAVLSEDQLGTLEQIRGNARAFARGRASGIRGSRGEFRRGQRSFRQGRREFRQGQRSFRQGRRGFRPGPRDFGPGDPGFGDGPDEPELGSEELGIEPGNANDLPTGPGSPSGITSADLTEASASSAD